MSFPTLYQLSDEYLKAIKELAEMDLPPEVVEDTLEGLSGEIETKATNVAMVIRNFESVVIQMKEAERQMALRRKAYESRIEHIRQYLLYNMKRTGITKIDSPWFSIAIRKNPAKVELTGIGTIPPEFMRQPDPPPPEADKRAIMEYLKSGHDVQWARIIQDERVDIK